MALPITISGAQGRAPVGGPFKSGTSFYFVATDGSTGINVFKADSDDPSSGWTAQDTTNNPVEDDQVASIHSFLDGTDLKISSQSSGGGDGEVEYHVFHCATDLWDGTIVNETVSTAPDSSAPFCSIAVRSDGDVIVTYAGEQESNMGTGYDRIDLARRESGSWTADISVDNLGKTTTHMRYPFVVMSANDRAHIFYVDSSASGDLHFSTYLSSNTWGHQHTSADTDHQSGAISHLVGFAYDDGGTEKIRVAYKDDTSLDVTTLGFDDANSPTASSTAGDISENIPSSSSGIGFAIDGTTQHLLYVNSSTIYHDETGAGNDTWGTDETELSSLTTPRIFSANVYDNGGTVLAYLYLDGSNYRYNERSLGGGTTTPQTITSTAIGTGILSTEATFLRTLAATILAVVVLNNITTYLRTLASTVTGTATLIKCMFQSLVSTVLGSATLLHALSFSKILDVTSTATASLTTLTTYLRSLIVTVVGTGVLNTAKTIGQSIGAGAIGTASFLKQVSKTLTVTIIGTPTLSTIITYLQNLVSTATATATLLVAQLILKSLAVVSIVTPSLTTSITYVRSLIAIVAGTPVLTRLVTYFRTLSGSGIGTGTILQDVTFIKNLTATVTGIPILIAVNSFFKTLVVTVTGTGILSTIITYSQALSATVLGIPIIAKTIFLTLQFGATGIATLTTISCYFRDLIGVATGTATIVKGFVFTKILTATAIGTGTISIIVNYLRNLIVTAVGTATIVTAKTTAQLLTATAIGTVTLLKNISKTLIVTATAIGTIITSSTRAVILTATAIGTGTLSAVKLLLQTLIATAIGTGSMIATFIPGAPAAIANVKRVVKIQINRWL